MPAGVRPQVGWAINVLHCVITAQLFCKQAVNSTRVAVQLLLVIVSPIEATDTLFQAPVVLPLVRLCLNLRRDTSCYVREAPFRARSSGK